MILRTERSMVPSANWKKEKCEMEKQGHMANLELYREKLYISKVYYLYFKLLVTTGLPNMLPLHDLDYNPPSFQYLFHQ